MRVFYALLFFLFVGDYAKCQGIGIIEGTIIGQESQEPVPYAKIYNKTLKKGTITSIDGYFRLEYQSFSDSVVITQIGYKPKTVQLNPNVQFQKIFLEENIHELGMVDLDPGLDSYLFELINRTRKKASSSVENTKAYYELKSYSGSQQLELVEGYYNMQLIGYDINDLSLKAARLALQPYQDRLFTSQAGSRAITSLKLTSTNDYFPRSPFDINKKEAQKTFRLAIVQRYKDEKNDSVYVISYWPRNENGLAFEGEIWLNVTDQTVEKITMNCENCGIHPFLPLFPDDSISNVELNITRTFTEVNGKMTFNHIDFDYKIDYKSRAGNRRELNYAIQTSAVLYAYDFAQTFEIPKFRFEENVVDYRKINALPYNSFFWENNNEYRINNSGNNNETFFLDSASITNVTLFRMKNRTASTADNELQPRENWVSRKWYFEHPYVRWSTNRIFIREMIADSITQTSTGNINALKYNLDAQVFFDINRYQDSTNILTATVFDPYTTFYYMPVDKNANCFINMYFDICEIERRKWENEHSSVLAAEDYEQTYQLFSTHLEKQKIQFLKEVERGTNRKAMEKWNSYISTELGIDNVSLFKLYVEE